MAIRYLILFQADRQLPDAAARKAGLRKVLAAHDLQLYVGETDELPLELRGNGFVIGHVFRRPPHVERLSELDDALTGDILRTKGQVLVDTLWGGYLCVVQNEHFDHLHLVRDPSGALPCLYLKLATGWAMASDMETLVEAGIISPSVDWSALHQHLVAYDLRTANTCLASIKECLAGTRITLSGNVATSEPCWSPWDHVRRLQTSHAQPEADALLETTTACLRSWAGAYPDILLGISGGFDSSVIATTLGCLPARTTCLTMATKHPEGDERRYARIAVEAARLPLIERFHRLEDIDPIRSSARHLPRPVLAAFGQSEYRQKVDLARELGADAYFTGIGGDNVFCHMRTANPIVDRLGSEGLTPAVWSTVLDVCDLTGCSVWEAIASAISRARRTGRYDWKGDYRLLSSRDQPSVPAHAWLNAPPSTPPGKLAHVAMITRIQGTVDGFPRRDTPAMINPLLSQPIVELCLGIPTWHWIEGGRDRSVARAAFSGQLPLSLTNRRTKGGPLTFAAEIVEMHRMTLRRLLCEGLLANKGIVDIQAIDEVLGGTSPVPSSLLLRLMVLTEAEVWSRQWR